MHAISLLLLTSCLAATAFSLERPTNSIKNSRLQTASAAPLKRSAAAASFQHSLPTFLKTSESPADSVVAAEPAKASFLSTIWNENTKLLAYLAVWYLGNIYCKFYICFHDTVKF